MLHVQVYNDDKGLGVCCNCAWRFTHVNTLGVAFAVSPTGFISWYTVTGNFLIQPLAWSVITTLWVDTVVWAVFVVEHMDKVGCNMVPAPVCQATVAVSTEVVPVISTQGL